MHHDPRVLSNGPSLLLLPALAPIAVDLDHRASIMRGVGMGG
jgi:hypothetical protein